MTARTAFQDESHALTAQDMEQPGVVAKASTGSYVINLCNVAVPITIPQPRSAPLSRFRFFLTTSREDGRKRYGLHMGYFPNAEEAHKWLDILRRIYPQAEVSETPHGQADLLSDTQALAILEQTSR